MSPVSPSNGAAPAQLKCEVLVVGLGPVGAVLAGLLADSGVDVVAIDRSTEVYPLPRAAHFDHEIMRVFQQLGIATEVLRHARTAAGYEFRSASGEVLVSFGGPPGVLAPGGWAGGYMFNQPGVEHALRAKLTASPKARVLLGAAFERFDAQGDHVDVEVLGPEGPLRVRARYLVGCDGAWSPVREAMGIQLTDLNFDEPWLVIDAVPRTAKNLPTVNLQICDPTRPTTCVLMGPGRHRWEFMLLPGETPEQVLDDAFIQDLLEPWAVDVEIERKAVYRFHGLVADPWRQGRVLIAGDAAHQMPPFAGQGMCSGIRDAANLAWKLAAILRQSAPTFLLDTYQSEREPNVRAYIQLAINMGRVVCILDPDAARMRNEQMLAARRGGVAPVPPAAPPPLRGPAVLEGSKGAGDMFPQPVVVDGDQTRRLDDVLGAGAWLLTAGAATEPTPAGLTRIDIHAPSIASFQPALSKWLGSRNAEAVLVRPDRYVFGTGSPATLATAWSDALGASEPAAREPA